MILVVSKKVAQTLMLAGFPQEPIVGAFYYHPMGSLVKCTQAKKNSGRANPHTLRAPSIPEAQRFCAEHNLSIDLTV